MARTPTTTDAFNAVAEASRRDLLDALGTEEATVGELVDRTGLRQPQVSKHLAVLREVGLVTVRKDGRRRWYRVNGPALRPIHDWVQGFEATWNARLDRLDDVVAELVGERARGGSLSDTRSTRDERHDKNHDKNQDSNKEKES
jgi:DNA-binding transcriptional ArsR family regulator